MGKNIGYLILHGFGGSIREIALLAQYLKDKGHIVAAPKLAGHTGKRRDLAKVGYCDWIASAGQAYSQLRRQCEKVIVVGFSMGGLLAVHLAVQNKVAAMVMMNMPIYYWDFKRIISNIREDFRIGSYHHIKQYLKTSFDKPLLSLIQFRILLSKTKPLLKQVKTPVFIVQALKDDTVQHRSAEYIHQHVASTDKRIKYYENAGHIICQSAAAAQAFEDVYTFVQDVMKKAEK